MTERILVSGRHQALCAVDATRRALEGGRRIESAAALLETIVENVADTMDRMADRIAQSLDEIEEQVLSTTRSIFARISAGLRRTCVRLHRQLSGLRIVFHRLEQKNPADLKPALQLRAGKLAQRLDGLDHIIVEMRERSRLLQEELHLKIEEQGNDNIRVLSVLTAILMPPTLITGIFGMNTKGLPFTDLDTAFLLGIAADGAVFVRGLSHHETHRRHQIVRPAGDETTANVFVARIIRSHRPVSELPLPRRPCRRQGRKRGRMAGPEMVQRMA